MEIISPKFLLFKNNSKFASESDNALFTRKQAFQASEKSILEGRSLFRSLLLFSDDLKFMKIASPGS